MDHLRVKTVELQRHIGRVHCREKIRRLSVIVQEIPRSGLRAERLDHQRDFRRRRGGGMTEVRHECLCRRWPFGLPGQDMNHLGPQRVDIAPDPAHIMGKARLPARNSRETGLAAGIIRRWGIDQG